MSEQETRKHECEVLITDFIERSMYAKQSLCEENPMSDNPPMFLCVFVPNKEEYSGDYENLESESQEMGLSRVLQCGMIPLIHKPDLFDCLSDVWSMLPIEKFEFAFVASEGYMDTAGQNGMTASDDYERGDMAKDFSENPFTTIREALVIHGFDWTNRIKTTVFVPYHYDDKGVPVYGDKTMTIDEVAEDYEPVGRLEQMMWAGVKFSNIKFATDKYRQRMESAPKRKKKEKE